MKDYEGMFVIRPDLNQEETDKVVQAIEGIISENKGELKDSSAWGKRALAHEMKGYTEGYYRLVHFRIDPGMVAKLERAYKLNESMLKYLIIRI